MFLANLTYPTCCRMLGVYHTNKIFPHLPSPRHPNLLPYLCHKCLLTGVFISLSFVMSSFWLPGNSCIVVHLKQIVSYALFNCAHAHSPTSMHTHTHTRTHIHTHTRTYTHRWDLLWIPLAPVAYSGACLWVVASLDKSAREVATFRGSKYDLKQVWWWFAGTLHVHKRTVQTFV